MSLFCHKRQNLRLFFIRNMKNYKCCSPLPILLAAIFFLTFSFKLSAQDGEKLFKQNCAVCHSPHTDQMGTGPGLKGVFDRIPKGDWITKWVLDNTALIKSGDAYAKSIKA